MKIDPAPSKLVVRRLVKQCFPNDKLDFTPDERYLALVADERPVGFSAFRACRSPNEGLGYVSAVGVIPERRGKGLQRQLIEHTDIALGEMGIKAVVTYVLPSNGPSLYNFLRCGYRTYVPDQWWAGDGVVYLHKELG